LGFFFSLSPDFVPRWEPRDLRSWIVRPKPQGTFFDNIKNDLSSPLFTANLKHNAPGTYDFGFIDSSKYKGEIAYTPVNDTAGFWGFTAQGYCVGGNSTVSLPVFGIAGEPSFYSPTPSAHVHPTFTRLSESRVLNSVLL
jgi:aspergillopepsin I